MVFVGVLFEHAEQVGLAHDQQRVAVDLDFGARPLAVQDLVALLDIERSDLAVLAAGARPDRDDFALLRLFLGGVRNDDPAGRLGFLLKRLDHNTIMKRPETHGMSPYTIVMASVSARGLLALPPGECQQISE